MPGERVRGPRARAVGNGAAMTLRIAVGEDSFLVREGIRRMLDTEPDVEVVGVAPDTRGSPSDNRKGRPRSRPYRYTDAPGPRR